MKLSGNKQKFLTEAWLAILGLALAAAPALAHPHVWVTAKAQILFGPDGKIAAIRQAWTFDKMYSAYATQGLGRDGKRPTTTQMAPLAESNIKSLAQAKYFTVAKTGPTFYEFGRPTDYSMDENAKKQVTLYFTLPLKTPVSAKKPFVYMVYDPTYFVDFEMAKGDPVTMKNAPSGCSISTLKPDPLNAIDAAKLSEAFYANLSPGANFGLKMATRAIVACP